MCVFIAKNLDIIAQTSNAMFYVLVQGLQKVFTPLDLFHIVCLWPSTHNTP
jgi:hypothetical protein